MIFNVKYMGSKVVYYSDTDTFLTQQIYMVESHRHKPGSNYQGKANHIVYTSSHVLPWTFTHMMIIILIPKRLGCAVFSFHSQVILVIYEDKGSKVTLLYLLSLFGSLQLCKSIGEIRVEYILYQRQAFVRSSRLYFLHPIGFGHEGDNTSICYKSCSSKWDINIMKMLHSHVFLWRIEITGAWRVVFVLKN